MKEHRFFARMYERLAPGAEKRGLADMRREVLGGLQGRVVEVGAGNGLNFAQYPTTVTEVIAVEPERYLRSQAEKAAGAAPVPVRVVTGVADALDLESGSIDAVVACGVLCSVPDQPAALAEFRRVLRPGGELRFYEHVRSQRPGFARWQRSVDPVWTRLFGGCHADRDTLGEIERAGFVLERCRGFPFPADARLYPVTPRILGVARAV